jgi:tetratricopeptide (TPR) repeat protein
MKSLKLTLLFFCTVLIASCTSLQKDKVIRLLEEISADITSTDFVAAWNKTEKAEAIAKKHNLDKELAEVLVSKARLCASDVERIDEGLEYAQEALRLAQDNDAPEVQCEACYSICSLYINNNLDPASNRLAGEWLERGQALADTYDIPRLHLEGINLRALWYQHNNFYTAAENYLEQALRETEDSDPLMISTLQDNLLDLYIRSGQYKKAFDLFKDSVSAKQAASQKMQEEMQASWHKESLLYKAIIVILLLVIATLAILLIRRISRDRTPA